MACQAAALDSPSACQQGEDTQASHVLTVDATCAAFCRDCLHKCRLGTSLRDIHQHSIKLVSEGIADLRLLPGQLATSIARDAYREFYPHSLGEAHPCKCLSPFCIQILDEP